MAPHWDIRSPTDDVLLHHAFGYFDDPPSYSSVTVRNSNAELLSRIASATPTSRLPTLNTLETSHYQHVRQIWRRKPREAVQPSSEPRPGSFIPKLPASCLKPEVAVSTPKQPPSFPKPHAPKGVTANQEDPLDQTKFPELTWPWRWGYIPSTTTNPASKVIAPINQETQEVYGSPHNKLPFANVNVNTPSSVTKDTARTALPIRSRVVQGQPMTFGESATPEHKPVPKDSFTAADNWKELSGEGTLPSSAKESPQLDDPEGLRSRLIFIRRLRERKYSDKDIDRIVTGLQKDGISFPEVLNVLEATLSKMDMDMAGSDKQLGNTAPVQAENAQKEAGTQSTTITTPATATKIPMPKNCNLQEKARLAVSIPAATGTVKSRCATKEIVSPQTPTNPKREKWLAINKPKISEKKKKVEEDFEALSLDEDEEGWEKVDGDEDWDIVDDPRLIVERKMV